MRLAYYYDRERRFFPFNYFIEKKIDGCQKIGVKKKKKIKVELINKIEKIVEGKGFFVAKINKPLKDYDFSEIRQRKDESTLIRILYYKYDNLIVLLDGFEKPRNYKGKKVKRIIKNHHKKAQNYCENIKNDPVNHIKKYERRKISP